MNEGPGKATEEKRVVFSLPTTLMPGPSALSQWQAAPVPGAVGLEVVTCIPACPTFHIANRVRITHDS